MKKTGYKNFCFKLTLENIEDLFFGLFICINDKTNIINKIRKNGCNLLTCFPQKMWKTIATRSFLMIFLILLCIPILFSCGSSKNVKKGNPALENAVINMTEDEVKKRLGEPDIVSKTPENHIIWTYKPSWKLLPNNEGTIYVEFEEGKVSKVVKAR